MSIFTYLNIHEFIFMYIFISKQHQQPKNVELETSLNKIAIDDSHMEVSLNNTVNNDTKEEEDMGIYEDNDKSGSDDESIDNGNNSQIQKKNKVTDLENNSQIDEVYMDRDHVGIDNDSDDNKWTNIEINLTSKLAQTTKFTLGEWQLLGPSPVLVPVGLSLVPAPVRIGPSVVPAAVGPYPVSVPPLPSKDDTKANEYYRSKECSAVYINSILTSHTSTHPPLSSTLDNKTLVVKNSNLDNLRFYADENPQKVPGVIPPYPPRAPLRPKSASAIPSNRMTRNINFEQDEKSTNFNGNVLIFIYIDVY
jgi:hypothetical protein